MFGIFKRVKALEAKLEKVANDALREKYVGKYARHDMVYGCVQRILDVRNEDGDIEIKLNFPNLGCSWQKLKYYSVYDTDPIEKRPVTKINREDIFSMEFSKQLEEMTFEVKLRGTGVVDGLIKGSAELSERLRKLEEDLKSIKVPEAFLEEKPKLKPSKPKAKKK